MPHNDDKLELFIMYINVLVFSKKSSPYVLDLEQF